MELGAAASFDLLQLASVLRGVNIDSCVFSSLFSLLEECGEEMG